MKNARNWGNLVQRGVVRTFLEMVNMRHGLKCTTNNWYAKVFGIRYLYHSTAFVLLTVMACLQ